MINSPSYYNFKNCYKPLKKNTNGNYINNNFSSDSSFNGFLVDKFNFYEANNIKECSDKARRHQAPFFLASNYEISNNNVNLFCYLPKPNSNSNSQFNSVFAPFNDLLDKLFLSGTQRDSLAVTIQESSGRIYTISENVCIRNIEDNYIYSASGNFALYENKILNDSVLTELSTIKSYDHYLAQKIQLDAFDYKTFLAKPGIGQSSGGELYNSFKNLLCNDNSKLELVQENRNNFVQKIKRIIDYREEVDTKLNELTEDLSKISLITNYSNEILDGLDNYIGDIKLTLKNLFASGGANNGRLGDISYLNNILFFENLIIFIILVSFIYITIKNKNNN